MRACINDLCGDWNEGWVLNCPKGGLKSCSQYASHTATVEFLPKIYGATRYHYFTKFKPKVGETLFRSEKAVIVRGFQKNRMGAKYFAFRPNTVGEKQEEEMRVCVRRTCKGHGAEYHGHCRSDARDRCGSYLPSGERGATRPRPPKNMTATEVLSRNAQFKQEYQCDWGSTHSADAFAYATEQMSRIINPPIIIKENKNMNEFDNALTNAKNGTLTNLTEKAENLKEVAKATATRTKNTVVRVKVGRLAIAAIKSAIKKTPGVPVYAKTLLDSEYADIVIGAVVPILVPMITTNKKAIKLSEDVNIAGGVAVADKLSFIDDFVAQVIAQVSSAIGPEDLVDDTAKDKL